MKIVKSIVFAFTTIVLFSTVLFSAGDAKLGKQIFMSKKVKNGLNPGNCIACHDVSGQVLNQPGMLGPKLSNLNLWPKDDLYNRIFDPTKNNPLSAMPPFGANQMLNEEEIQHLVAYLQTIK